MDDSQNLSPFKSKTISTTRLSPLKLRSSRKHISEILYDNGESKRTSIITTLMKSTASIIQVSKLERNSLANQQTNEYYRNPDYIKEDKTEDFDKYYEEICLLGEGSSSIVKKCQSLVDNKIYAVKIMRTTESEIIEQAKNEFANLNALNHELIIKVYEMFINKSKGRVNIVMEFMDGFENLHQSVADKGPIPENAAKNIFRMLLEAINEMHIHGICHRDLKPGNILLCNEDSLRIIDFNISKRVPLLFFNHKSKKNISMMSNRGSLEYLAPEMLQGFNEYSEQVDMWAAGVILYFILSGESPFQAENTSEIISKIVTADFGVEGEKWKQISKEAKNLIHSLLQIDYKKRLSALEALAHPWIKSAEFKRPHKKISYGTVCCKNLNKKGFKEEWKLLSIQVQFRRAKSFANYKRKEMKL